MKKFVAVAMVVAVVLGLVGCNQPSGTNSDNAILKGTIKIGYQNGMSYAPFYVMQEKKLVEKYLGEGVTVEYTTLASGAVMGESLAANQLDVGVIGSAPLLTAWDKGVNYKMLSGLICSPLGLVTMDESKKSLKDFTEKDKIAVPAPNSIQGILLSMAAEKELGNPKALDSNLIAMAHPDAMAALVNKINLSGHYSTAPYLFETVAKGGKVISDANEAFGGDYSFVVAASTEKFMTEQPLYAAAVYMALNEAIELVNTKDDSTLDIIAKKENLTKEKVIEYLDWEGTNFSTTPYGFIGLAKFMKDAKYISKVPESMRDISWSTASAIVGKRAGEPSVVEKAQERPEK